MEAYMIVVSILTALVIAVAGLVLLYIVVRLGAIAWYRTRRDYENGHFH